MHYADLFVTAIPLVSAFLPRQGSDVSHELDFAFVASWHLMTVKTVMRLLSVCRLKVRCCYFCEMTLLLMYVLLGFVCDASLDLWI